MNGTNTTSTDFAIDDTNLTTGEKVVMIFLWVIIEVVGNGLLFGLIQFDRIGGDPLKRRIIDQVNQSTFWKMFGLWIYDRNVYFLAFFQSIHNIYHIKLNHPKYWMHFQCV